MTKICAVIQSLTVVEVGAKGAFKQPPLVEVAPVTILKNPPKLV